MEKFLSIENFKEVRVFLILEIIITLLMAMLIDANKFDVNYWDWRAFTVSMFIWSVSAILDKKTYLNLATLLATAYFMYLFWWLVLTIQFN